MGQSFEPCQECSNDDISRVITGDEDEFERRYEVGEAIGQGAFGEVFLCWSHFTPEERHVVKQVPRRGANWEKELEGGKLMHALEHQNVVRLIDVFQGDRYLYIVMERIEGQELYEAVVNPSIKIGVEDYAKVALQLLNALAYLQGHHVVHRDVKAENIMLSQPPVPGGGLPDIKLIDFGLASRVKCPHIQGHEQFQEILGTPPYLAPEMWAIWLQAQNVQLKPKDMEVQEWPLQYGHKVDVYAAGVTIYLGLFGTYPYPGNAEGLVVSRASGAEAVCNGAFRQWGKHQERPLFLQVDGPAIIYCARKEVWRMHVENDKFAWSFEAPRTSGECGPYPPEGKWVGREGATINVEKEVSMSHVSKSKLLHYKFASETCRPDIRPAFRARTKNAAYSESLEKSRDFVEGLLERLPCKRVDAATAANHPWLRAKKRAMGEPVKPVPEDVRSEARDEMRRLGELRIFESFADESEDEDIDTELSGKSE